MVSWHFRRSESKQFGTSNAIFTLNTKKSKAFRFKTWKFDEMSALWRWNCDITSLGYIGRMWQTRDNGSNKVNCSLGVSRSSLTYFFGRLLWYTVSWHVTAGYIWGSIFPPQVFKIAALWITSVEAYLSKTSHPVKSTIQLQILFVLLGLGDHPE